MRVHGKRGVQQKTDFSRIHSTIGVLRPSFAGW
jgi:hypothetical protein